MMQRDDPFAGIVLSEQAGLDQRLFTEERGPTLPSPPPEGSPTKPGTQETRKEGRRETSREGSGEGGRETSQQRVKEVENEVSHEAGKQTSQEAMREPAREAPLPDLPVFKNSFLYTEEESNLFDEIKLDLRRTHGRKVTKNDIARAAIRFLAQDYYENPETSFLKRNLPRK